MATWRPSGASEVLVRRMEAHGAPISGVLGLVGSQIALDSVFGDSPADNAHRNDNYLIRFVAPVAELAGWPHRNPGRLTDYLAAHLQLAWLWRMLDNLLDAPLHAEGRELRARQYGAAVARAAVRLNRLDIDLANLEEALAITTAASIEERRDALPLARIPERAAPFNVIPRTLLSQDRVTTWLQYISVVGLLHDIHDVARDLELGIQTLPTVWLRDISPAREFRPDILGRWCSRCADELSSALATVRRVDEGAVLRALLDEATEYADELRQPFGRVTEH